MLLQADAFSVELESVQVSSGIQDSSQYQADINNALAMMVSIFPLISKSSNPFNNLLGIVPRAPIITGITVTLMFHSFFLCFFFFYFSL